MIPQRTRTRGAAATAFALAVLAGHITDRTTGQPLPSVSVSLGLAHATTAKDGTYKLTNVKPGAGVVTLQSDDVPPQQFSVSIKRTGMTNRDFTACSITLDYQCASH